MENEKLNKAVLRSIDILDYLAKCKKPAALSTISKDLGIPKSSVFDIIHTLVYKKMVQVDEDTKCFSLDVHCFEIGSTYLSRTDIHTQARPILKQLSLQTSETTFLAVENNGMIVYLDKEEGSSPTRTTCVIGDRNDMYSTGLGKAILATLPIEKIRLITGGGKLTAKTPNTKTSFEALMADLELTRQRGYSIDNREDNDYVFCVGAPILNQSGDCIGSISISAIYTSISEERLNFFSQLITGAALEISHKFGYSGEGLYPMPTYGLDHNADVR